MAKPGDKQSRVLGIREGRLHCALAARAVEGAANEALIELLREITGLPRRRIQLVSGERSREKRVALRDYSLEQAQTHFALERPPSSD